MIIFDDVRKVKNGLPKNLRIASIPIQCKYYHEFHKGHDFVVNYCKQNADVVIAAFQEISYSYWIKNDFSQPSNYKKYRKDCIRWAEEKGIDYLVFVDKQFYNFLKSSFNKKTLTNKANCLFYEYFSKYDLSCYNRDTFQYFIEVYIAMKELDLYWDRDLQVRCWKDGFYVFFQKYFTKKYIGKDSVNIVDPIFDEDEIPYSSNPTFLTTERQCEADMKLAKFIRDLNLNEKENWYSLIQNHLIENDTGEINFLRVFDDEITENRTLIELKFNPKQASIPLTFTYYFKN